MNILWTHHERALYQNIKKDIQPPLLAIDESVWIRAAIRHRFSLLLCLVPCAFGLHGTSIDCRRPHTGGEVHHGGAIVRPETSFQQGAVHYSAYTGTRKSKAERHSGI